MSRRSLLAIVALAAVVLLAFAASAQPVRLWDQPKTGTDSPSLDGGAPGTVVPPTQEPDAESEHVRDLGPLLQVLAVVAIAVAVAAVAAMRRSRPNGWPVGGTQQRRIRRFASLPEVTDSNLDVNVEQARAALSIGQPRNAIVACWMRLEGDIAAAGWPRSGAETSAEYVERVIAEASVDPLAISDLAALYREARFSDHSMRDADRAFAFDALSRVESSLRFGVRVPS